MKIKFPTKKTIETYVQDNSTGQIADDFFQAGELYYEALEARENKITFDLMQQAMKKCPLYADAYTFMSGYRDTYNKEYNTLCTALVVAQKVLEILDNPLEHYEGECWMWIETRPYMRALFAFGQCAWHLGDFGRTIGAYERCLTLNPNDNQGVRHFLTTCYITCQKYDDFLNLCERYKDDTDLSFVYSKALVLYINNDDSKDNHLKMALERNPYVPRLMLEYSEKDKPVYSYMYGNEDEAQYYVQKNFDIWKKTNGAIKWLTQSIAN